MSAAIIQLDELIKEMESLTAKDDPEREHGEADSLLVEALNLIAENLDETTRQKIDRLINLYNQVEKWYS